MKKIGILTLYHNTMNYGGSLQAYALCKFLQNKGHSVEQIDYSGKLSKRKRIKILLLIKRRGAINKIIKCIGRAMLKPIMRHEEKKYHIYFRRRKAFSYFNTEVIPHTSKIYTKENICNINANYDGFIVGSDQVWNVAIADSTYFLDFVDKKKLKISYAASISRGILTQEEQKIFFNNLQDYKAVSVREINAVKLLKDLSPVEPQLVLDPTLLLTKKDWDIICAERVIEEEYVFCYFLGENTKERKIAEIFAQKEGLTLVSIPHTAGIKLIDRKFGDKRLYDATPQQFLSLIKHAKYVFTDSFHAVVFSNIYQKNYFVFNRNKKGEMNSRIINITQLFHQEERFCNGKERESFEYIQSLPDINYTRENKEFEKLKEKSIDFLKENLG